MPSIRPLDEQYEPDKVAQIRALISRYDELVTVGSPARYLVVEIKRCLEGGLLLAAILIADALLEMCIRQLVVFHRARTRAKGGPRSFRTAYARENRKVERDPAATLERLVAELETRSLIEPDDAKAIRAFREVVRIPLHYGLPGRHVRGHEDLPLTSVFKDLGQSVTFFQFESVIEDHALRQLAIVPTLIDRYTSG